jgi:hypothetical protein
MEIVQEVICNFRNGDVLYVQLISLDKKQEQVERPLKLGELYGKGYRHGTGASKRGQKYGNAVDFYEKKAYFYLCNKTMIP